MQEAAARAKAAGAVDGKGAADLVAVAGLEGGAQLMAAMGELALDAVGAGAHLLPVAAQLRLGWVYRGEREWGGGRRGETDSVRISCGGGIYQVQLRSVKRPTKRRVTVIWERW
jgi:hypothetical protein